MWTNFLITSVSVMDTKKLAQGNKIGAVLDHLNHDREEYLKYLKKEEQMNDTL